MLHKSKGVKYNDLSYKPQEIIITTNLVNIHHLILVQNLRKKFPL